MLKEERQDYVLKRLTRVGKVLVSPLAKELGTTPETIRRDLAEMEHNQLLIRVHGGAVPFEPAQQEMVFDKKMGVNTQAKRKVAQRCASMIKDGDTIAVDIGTSTIHIADMIEGVRNLTVVTNSLAAAIRFNIALEEGRMTGQVIVLPGITNPYQSSIKGSYTVDFLRGFHFNRAFISCGGITDGYAYDYDLEETMVSTVMLQCANEAILLTDSSKLGKRTLCEIAPLNKFLLIVCDVDRPDGWKSSGYQWKKVEDK